MVSLGASDVFLACFALVSTVAAGTVAHELCHAAILRTLGVPHEIRWLPDRRATGLRGGIGRWAVVVPRRLPAEVPPWGLRLAALAPLALATPMVLVLLGVLPDPLASGDVVLSAASIGWTACAIPSPRDFSLVWHAGAVVGAGDTSARSSTDGSETIDP